MTIDQIKKLISRKTEMIIMVILTILALWLMMRFANIGIFQFWAACAGQIGLAVLGEYLLRRMWPLSIIVFALACIFPAIVENVFQVNGLRGTVIVYILAAGWVHKPMKKQKAQTVPIVWPEYLPDGYIEYEVSDDKNKYFFLTEIIFSNSSDEHIIQITSSSKVIQKNRKRKNFDTVTRKINQTNVMIKYELTEITGEQYPFIEANWILNEVYYQLRSDGIHLPEVEKIVTSMIK